MAEKSIKYPDQISRLRNYATHPVKFSILKMLRGEAWVFRQLSSTKSAEPAETRDALTAQRSPQVELHAEQVTDNGDGQIAVEESKSVDPAWSVHRQALSAGTAMQGAPC